MLEENTIVIASRNDELDDFKALVENEGVYVFESSHLTMFHLAIEHDSVKIMTYLVDQGVLEFNKEIDSGVAMIKAIQSGANMSVDFLLERGADPNIKRRGRLGDLKPISLAAKIGNMGMIISLLKVIEQGVGINDPENMRPPLVEACQSSRSVTDETKLGIVQLLLLRGADVNRVDFRGRTPLAVCIQNDKMEIAQILVNVENIDLEVRDEDGATLLSRACQDSKPDTVRFLLQHGADVNTLTKGRLQGQDVTHNLLDILIYWKVRNPSKSKEMAELLFRHGFDANKRDANGFTYLIKSAVQGNLPLVKKLVLLGVDINAMDVRGVTAFTHATRGVTNLNADMHGVEQFSVAKFLAEKNANGHEGYSRFPELMDLRNRNAIPNEAVAIHDSLEDVKGLVGLIKEGSDVDGIHNGYTPLVRACQKNLLETVTVLVGAGASIEKPNTDGTNPLIMSSSVGSIELISFLLGRGADISYRTRHGNALMAACHIGHHEAAIFLIEAGINIDETDDKGFTCIHSAVVNNDSTLLEILISRGARVNGLALGGVSAAMITRVEKNVNLRNILIENGAILSAQYASEKIVPTKRLGETFGKSFREMRLSDTAMRRALSGNCEYIDHIMLEDGRCLHFSTRGARRVMMRLLDVEVDPDRYILPTQLSGTCWFNAIMSMMFLSDLTRKHTLPLRRSMIRGRTSENGEKFPVSFNHVFTKFNTKIQAILLGNTGEEDVMLPIINNEEVILGLLEIDFIQIGLNCGLEMSQYVSIVQKICDYLSPTDMPLMHRDGTQLPRDNFLAPILYRTRPDGSPYPLCISDSARDFEKKENGNTYVADSIAVSDDEHVIAGLTLGGKRYMYDSNVGRIEMDWSRFLKNPGERFVIGDREYSFYGSHVVVMYALVD